MTVQAVPILGRPEPGHVIDRLRFHMAPLAEVGPVARHALRSVEAHLERMAAEAEELVVIRRRRDLVAFRAAGLRVAEVAAVLRVEPKPLHQRAVLMLERQIVPGRFRVFGHPAFVTFRTVAVSRNIRVLPRCAFVAPFVAEKKWDREHYC